MKNKRKELVLLGGTYSNKGGSAIVYGTLKVLKELKINIRSIVDPGDFPNEFFKGFKLTPIHRYSDALWAKPTPSVTPAYTFYPFLKCLMNSYSPAIRGLFKIPIWYIGDSSLNDYRSVLSLLGQIVNLHLLKRVTKGKLIIGGVSLGYSRTKIGELALKLFVREVDYFFVRGQASYDNLIEKGVPHRKISIICDFAFHLDERKSRKSEEIFNKLGGLGQPAVALIFGELKRPRTSDQYITAIRRLVLELLKYDWKVYFVPTTYGNFMPENDLIFLKKLEMEKIQVINIHNLEPEEIIHVFGGFDAVISTRLHGTVYSILANVPTIHIYGAHSSLDLMEDFKGMVPLIKIADFADGIVSTKEMVNILEDLLERKDEISSEMRSLLKSMRVASISKLKYVLEERRLVE